MNLPLTLGKSSPLSHKDRRQAVASAPSSVKKSAVSIPEEAKTSLPVAYETLINILQQSKGNTYHLGKDQTLLAIKILEGMKYLFINANQSMSPLPAPVNQAVTGLPEHPTGMLNILTIQSLLHTPEDNIVKCLQSAAHLSNAPSIIALSPAPIVQQMHLVAEKSQDTEVVISMSKIDKQHIL